LPSKQAARKRNAGNGKKKADMSNVLLQGEDANPDQDTTGEDAHGGARRILNSLMRDIHFFFLLRVTMFRIYNHKDTRSKARPDMPTVIFQRQDWIITVT
jgi:hypothetical protein